MIFSDDVFARIVIFILGLCGFWVARHIYKHKKPNQAPLICPMNFDCNAVVHSDYSKFFSIPVEILGMIYYGFLSISYFFLIFMSDSLPPVYVVILILMSLIAFLFSVFLIGVQIFILKKGCFWCFVSAFICICIFLITIPAYDLNYIIRIFV